MCITSAPKALAVKKNEKADPAGNSYLKFSLMSRPPTTAGRGHIKSVQIL